LESALSGKSRVGHHWHFRLKRALNCLQKQIDLAVDALVKNCLQHAIVFGQLLRSFWLFLADFQLVEQVLVLAYVEVRSQQRLPFLSEDVGEVTRVDASREQTRLLDDREVFLLSL